MFFLTFATFDVFLISSGLISQIFFTLKTYDYRIFRKSYDADSDGLLINFNFVSVSKKAVKL